MLAITGEKWELQYKRKAIFLASRDLKRGLALFAWLILLLLPFFYLLFHFLQMRVKK